MSTRPARSSSIPIPRSFPSTSPSRNIEDAITIPFAVPRRYSSTRGSPEDSRGGVSRTVRREAGNSPVRPTARSYPRTSTMLSRSTPRITTFEPRIVRAEATRSTDPTCSPTSSPTRTRRTSTGRAPSSNRTSSVHFPSQSSPVAPFTRPAYLEHAALRHLLQADSHSTLPPLRKLEASYRAQHYSTLDDSDEDVSPPPPDASKRTSSIPPGEEPLQLPTRWSDGRHHSLNISLDGRDLTFQGAHSTADRDGVAGAARTDHPIPPACGIYYFEVEVRSKLSTAHISIGLAAGDVKLSRLPGWEPNSWGYHGDDGRSFASEKNGTTFGPTYGSGDIVGCGLDFTSGRVFFTKNGTLIGHVFENVGRNSKLYPSVGLKNSNDSIRLNLGQDAFKYDIEFHVQNQRSSAWASLLKQPLHLSVVHEGEAPPPPVATTDGMVEDETKSSLSRLVMSYLGHHGYSKTLVALQKDTHQTRSDMDTEGGASSGSNHDEGFESRTHIVQCVMSGDLDTAISETQLHHPSVLEAEDGIMLFKMRCRKFVELVMETVELKKALQSRNSLGNTSEDMADGMDVDGDVSMEADIGKAPTSEYEAALSNAIAYGQSLTNDYKADRRTEVKDIFMQTFGILAFEDPRDVPSVAAVVGNEAKVSLANQLNQAILRSQGRPPEPALETFYRHTAVCMQQLALLGVGFAPFVDMKREFLEG